MPAFRLVAKSWFPRSIDDELTPPKPVSRSALDMERELVEAVTSCASQGHGFGDAFVFGQCSEPSMHALSKALGADARLFCCVDSARSKLRRRGRVWIETVHFDARSLATLRARHFVRRISVVMMADDFAWSVGRVIGGLGALLAPQAALLIAGQQAALLEAMWLDELRRGQNVVDVQCFEEPASAWARFRLQRRNFA
jgi:hypothetical protein